VTGGAIGGLFDVIQDFLPKLGQDMDVFARNLILETNRIHSTGIGAKGPYQMLTGTNALQDLNKSGSALDELLANAGLPFDVVDGELYVNVTESATGAVTKHRIDIDASRTTVSDLVYELNSIDHVSSSLDSKGHLQVFADTGWGFDFSSRLDPNPDEIGSFGGGAASLATASGPFALSPGDTLDLAGPLGPFTVSFNAGSFAQIGQATAEEVAAVINADPNVQANGLTASVVDGHLVLQTVGAGASESFGVAGGSALGALGWTAGTTVTGQDSAVAVAVSGEYTGSGNGVFTFRPNMDGTIGTTPGLKVKVFDEAGQEVAELDVGPGYSPGTDLDVADGVVVSFGFGDLSASSGDLFVLDVVADADTSDVLPALGLNVLFTGHDAATIEVREDILRAPDLLASSISGGPSDGSNLIKLLALQNESTAGLGGASLPEGWADVVGSVALEISATSNAAESETFLLESLEQRRDQVSGVNVDEELVLLIEQEQAFTAASQYIRVISELTNELMSLV
jgi:flagellar hook-associated protein FlgK